MASEDISAVASLFILLIGGVCGCILAIWRSERRRQQRHRRHHHQRGGRGWRHEAAERRERLRSKVGQLISAFRQRGRAGTSRGGGGRQKRGDGSMTTWKQRWFALHDGSLQYYDRPPELSRPRLPMVHWIYHFERHSRGGE